MNTAVLKPLILSSILLLLSAGTLAYVFYDQKTTGERLLEFGNNLEAWDKLNRARVDLNSGEMDRLVPMAQLRSLVLKDEIDTIGLLAYIDDLGVQTGVAVSTSELKVTKTAEKKFDHIAATLSLRGGEGDVAAMIALLESLPYRSHIESMTLTRTNGVAEAVVELRVSALE